MTDVTLETLSELLQQRGSKESFRLQTLTLPAGLDVGLIGGAVIGDGDGPLVCAVGSQHGNEWNGQLACHEIYRSLSPVGLRGTVLLLPVLNPLAFLEKRRTSGIDLTDMNRVWVRRSLRKPTEQLARLLFDGVLRRSNYLFDLHSGGPGEYLPSVAVLGQERFPLAQTLGLSHVLVAGNGHEGGLVDTATRAGIDSFLVELGGGRRLQPHHVDRFVSGFQNFLRYTRMADGEVEQHDPTLVSKKTWVPSPVTGLFEPLVTLGQTISQGQPLCRVTPLFGEPQQFLSPENGVVLYLRCEELVAAGENLAHIAS